MAAIKESELFSLDDPARLAELRRTALLDSGAEEAFDRLTHLATVFLKAPVSLISLIDADRQYFKSCRGLPEPWASSCETPLSHSFCQHSVASGEPLVVRDARRDPRLCDNLAIRDLHAIAYLGIPLTTSDGYVLGSFCVIDHRPRRWSARQVDGLRLLTASVMTEIERRLLEQKLRMANTSKSEFLAHISHEIRTPMAAIMGYADLLTARLDDPDALQSVQTIQRNGHHLLELINDLLDLSKIEAGRLEVARERVNLNALISEVVSLMDVRAQEKGLQLNTEGSELLPETIESDTRRLKQILINLVGNAIKFTDQGSVTLRLDLIEEPSPAVRFAVIDTGPGIATSAQDELFEPFIQSNGPGVRSRGGTGLGLSISRRLAERLGGRIVVDSCEGRGATFTATVAAGPLDGVPRSPLRLAYTGSGAAGTPSSADLHLAGRVLVVDDRTELRNLVQRYLEEAGASVSTAADGAHALDAVALAAAGHTGAATDFDAIVLDMRMPVMDGFTTARRLRSQGYRGGIIALTAHAMTGDRSQCLAAGCDAYLSKPIERNALIKAVAPYLPASRAPTPAVPNARRRVLVVDDAEDTAEVLAKTLRLLGFEADTALNGQAAIFKARTTLPDVVILDLNLPDLSGYSVCRRLQQEPGLRQTVFIALSGQADDEGRSNGAGFDHWVLKPASAAELVKLFAKRALPTSKSVSF